MWTRTLARSRASCSRTQITGKYRFRESQGSLSKEFKAPLSGADVQQLIEKAKAIEEAEAKRKQAEPPEMAPLAEAMQQAKTESDEKKPELVLDEVEMEEDEGEAVSAVPMSVVGLREAESLGKAAKKDSKGRGAARGKDGKGGKSGKGGRGKQPRNPRPSESSAASVVSERRSGPGSIAELPLATRAASSSGALSDGASMRTGFPPKWPFFSKKGCKNWVFQFSVFKF